MCESKGTEKEKKKNDTPTKTRDRLGVPASERTPHHREEYRILRDYETPQEWRKLKKEGNERVEMSRYLVLNYSSV